MPEMKDSGIEWIDKIPIEWKTDKLKYMFSFGKGLSISIRQITRLLEKVSPPDRGGES